MCVPGCHEVLIRRFARRPPPARRSVISAERMQPSRAATAFAQVVDLTHTLWPDFPTADGHSTFRMRPLLGWEADRINMWEWVLGEHTGTHIDAPLHFSQSGDAAEKLQAEELVAPLAVIDIRQKVADDPDYLLTPADIAGYEQVYGHIPPGACVALLSGWDEFVTTEKFRNADAKGRMHFPGFHVTTAEIFREKEAVGVATDTLSLDNGPSTEFPFHYRWLGLDKWGAECVANLADVPPAGATIVVGAPKVLGASGGPCRIFALV